MIKKYQEFIKEEKSANHDFGCVMLDLDVPNWNEITSIIDPNDLYEVSDDSTYGLQTDPHVTVLYGLHGDIDDSKVAEIINKWKYQDLDLEITGLDNFKNDNFEVVKFSVNPTQNLQDFNRDLSQLPNSNELPEYKPHITVGYVKPGTSDKYLNPNHKLDFKIKHIKYSKPNGQDLLFNLY
jgi:hypothetical protein